MSEYQYYEFQAVDRLLTEKQMAEVRKLSSRVVPTPTQAVFTYSFGGDLPASAEKVLDKYFDAMLYLANWGSRRLMFRFPPALIDLEQVRPYEVDEMIEFRRTSEHILLDIHFEEEDGSSWIEGEGHLAPLVKLRDDLLEQDHRLLYLAWLKAISLGEVEESEIEPPVPPGLNSLSAGLRAFVDLVEIDPHWVAVAAKASTDRQILPEEDLVRAIGQLSRDEIEDYLQRLLRGEPQLALVLRKHLHQFVGVPESVSTGQRTAGELREGAEEESSRQRAEQARKAERKRLAELQALAQREDAAWQDIEILLQKYTAQNYDQAVQLISKLHEVAALKHNEAAFQTRLNSIYEHYRTRHSLLERLRSAGLDPA